MSASDLYTRDTRVIAAVEKLRFFPLSVVGGQGAYLITEDGRRILDLTGSWGAASLGYSHPAVVDAVSSTLRSMPSAGILSMTNAPAVAFAERLLSLVPGDAERRVWLGHSGSDANETAVRVLQAATGRQRFIAFEGAYHGGTTGSMAVSAHLAQDGAEKHDGLHLVAYPNTYRHGADHGAVVLEELDALLATTCPPDEVAAVLLEPIMSDGGMIVPPAGFVAGLAARCRRYGIPLLCDEVKVGTGRTGSFFAFEAEDVVPDLVSVGKGIGAGLPLSALIAPAEMLDSFTAFAMQTTCGNPVSASAGLAVLETLHREGLIEQAAARGDRLQAGLRTMGEQLEVVGDVRGRGLAVGVELVTDRTSRAPAGALAAKVVFRAAQLGVAVFCVGFEANVLELTPPLVIEDEEIDRGVEVLAEAIRDVLAGTVSDDDVAAYSGW